MEPLRPQFPSRLQLFWGKFREGNWGSTWRASSCTEIVVGGVSLALVASCDWYLNQSKLSANVSPSSCRALFHSSLDVFMKKCVFIRLLFLPSWCFCSYEAQAKMPPPALLSPLSLLQVGQIVVDFCISQSLERRRPLDSPAFRMS